MEFYDMQNVYVVCRGDTFRLFLDPVEAREFADAPDRLLLSFHVYRAAGSGIDRSNMHSMSAREIEEMHTWTPLVAEAQ